MSIKAKKSLGQNFLVDKNIINKIISVGDIKKNDVVIGMYHDQVLTPIKALYEFNAINLTLGLPFIRVSPDHGPNSRMLGKNLSNANSLKEALIFLKKISVD